MASQHLSETGASASPVSPLVNAAVVLLGSSVCAFAIGMAGSHFGSGVRLSPALILLFRATAAKRFFKKLMKAGHRRLPFTVGTE